MSRLVIRMLVVAVMLTLPQWLGAVEKITVFALFTSKAIISIDGTRRVLSAGQTSPEGVKLIRTDTELEIAEIEINGRRETLSLGVVSSAPPSAGQASSSITLWADRGGFFYTAGTINGAEVRFLVDTGANTIAMSSRTADRIGLDYKRHGRAALASTASGVVPMYSLKLNTVTVGEITVHNVDAGVIQGDHPADVLLGMSFLGHLSMTRDGNKMELTKSY
ncbi:MAG: TIGR02281 family clan AA aspartic protease [Acidiferrobacterales bacterium]